MQDRPQADGVQWLTLAGFILLLGIAVSWRSVPFGLVSRRVENASTLPLIVLILPMVSSGFVPMDSFPAWLQGFAHYQPFTPSINTVRALLAGTPAASDTIWAIGWLLAIAVVGYAWSLSLYRCRTTGK